MIDNSSSTRPFVPARTVFYRLALGVLLVNLFVAALAASFLRQNWLSLHERAETGAINLARVLEEEILGDLEKIDLSLLTASEEVQRQLAAGPINAQALNAFLHRQLVRLPEIVSLRVTNEAGQVLFGDGLTGNPVSVADRGYFTRQRDSRDAGLVIDGPVLARISQQWSVPLSRRVSHADGSFAGVVYANLSLEHLVKTFRSLDVGRNGVINLRDGAWRFIVRYPETKAAVDAVGKPVMSAPLKKLVDAGLTSGTYEASAVLDDVDRTFAFRRIGDFPLYVTVGMASEDYMTEWWRSLAKLAAWQLLFFLFTVIASRTAYLAWKRQEQALDSLHNSEERFRFTLESSPIGMAVVSLSGTFLQVNHALCEIVGYSRQELKSLDFQTITHPDDLASDLANVQRLLAGEISSYQMEKRYRRKDGEFVWVQLTASVVRDSGGRPLNFVVQIENIAERRRVSEQQALSAKVFEGSGEAIVITDSEERILSVNKAFTEVTGYDADEVLGKTPRVMASGRQDADFYRSMWRTIAEIGHWSGEIEDRRKSGEIYPKWLRISVVRNAERQITHYIGVFSDITERKRAEAHIEFLAYHDALTQLPNRLLAMDHLELAIAHADRAGTRTAILFLDLDNFKTINDSFGHAIGDVLLQAVATRLLGSVRETDTVSRQGGDEFLIVLPDVADTDAITTVAEKILESLEETFQIEGREIATSLSIGVAVYPEDGSDIETLLKLADTAMYHAKEAGRNTYRFYTEQMNVHAIEHQRIRVGLRRALERGELVLHYQPQIDLCTGAVIGVEALVRWNSLEQGMLFPGAFIPTAEETGLIVPIGDWVLREACRQAMAWRAAGLPDLVMAVNVSATQFKRGDLEQSVVDALAESGLPAACLELELTESILIQDTDKVLETVSRLKARGITLSIDDFGTGYSSLSYLKRFDVDKLKIDRSFVSDMMGDSQDATIVRAIVQMAKSLNLKTIAEGVENERHLAYLKQVGCDEAQGYYVARPLPVDACTSFLAGAGR